jgi:uncharacterized Zn-binding protein involved in type VI secretion
MKRYDIVKGDPTTVGGVVQTGDGADLIDDLPIAYERDPVWCPVCKTMGTIACDGPRVSTLGPDGRETALSDDLCICRCAPPPRLIASQRKSFMEI